MDFYVVTCTNPTRCIGTYIIKAHNGLDAWSRASDYLTEKHKVKPSEVIMGKVNYAEEIP